MHWSTRSYPFFIICTTMLVTLKLQELGIGLDSAIYASVARNVMENGSWLNPTYTEFYHTPFAEHPPLMFWLQAIVFVIFGATDVTARLVSIVTGIASVTLTYAIGKRMIDERFGFLSALVLMLTVNYLSMCFKTFIEILFFFCILVSLFGFVRGSRDGRLSSWFIFGLGLGAAFLAKGIVIAGYILGLGIFLLFWQRDLFLTARFWLGVLVAFVIPGVYIFLEATYGKNYFVSYYFGQQIFNRALRSSGEPNYINYTLQLFNLYWPWLPFLFAGIYYAIRKKHIWIRLFVLILLSYALFHSISSLLNWQYFANVYVFGAFISAYAWYQWPCLQFDHQRFKERFLIIVTLLFILIQALPVRVHHLRDKKLLSFTPYAEQIFQTYPRRVLFTQKAFGIWSAPAKMKWYWNTDAKYALTIEDLLQSYLEDDQFSFVLVDESELPDLIAVDSLGFKPIVKNESVVLAARPGVLATEHELINVAFPKEFFR